MLWLIRSYRVRCLSAKTWEDRPNVLRQIESIGEKSYDFPFRFVFKTMNSWLSLKILAENGVTTLNDLRKQDPLRLEIVRAYLRSCCIYY
jgi:ATP-dependent DNA helicase HFM1/MER3